MPLPVVPPRMVKIGDAAAFVGTTPRAVRHYHDIGLLPEPERGSDDRRRYGYDEMIRLLWIRRMVDAGIALEDIRDAFTDTAPAAGGDHDVTAVLERLENRLLARQADLQRQRTAVQRMRTQGTKAGLLSEPVARRLEGLPEGSLRQADLDALLVTERTLGPLVATVQASRFITLARDPGLREESDRVDAAEEALDDSVAVDDPRVAQVAAERHAFELALQAAIAASGLDESDEELIDSWDAQQSLPESEVPAEPGSERGTRTDSMSVFEALGKMPYDFSPARLRCMELSMAMEIPEPAER